MVLNTEGDTFCDPLNGTFMRQTENGALVADGPSFLLLGGENRISPNPIHVAVQVSCYHNYKLAASATGNLRDAQGNLLPFVSVIVR
jgi:hypothetical protein